jgi:hypothetical protein
MNGFVYLNDNVIIPDDSEIYYTYLENNLIYKEINVNGHFSQNPFLLDKYVVLYALPVASSSGISRNRGIYHVVGDSIPAAINQITNASSTEPVAIIGAINIKPFVDKRNINITDTRSFGGGLRDDGLGEATAKKFKESQYFNDISRVEGIPYPGNGSVVVELPDDLKEVMPIADIKRRAGKYVAAGVYQIYDFQEELSKPSQYAADISSMHYAFEYADAASGEVGWWFNTDVEIPDSIYSGYTTGDLATNPTFIPDENKMVLNPGNIYTQPYLRSSPDPYFTWEEKGIGQDWEKKTWRDTRSIGSGMLAAGELVFSAEYGHKEIRNLTGFAPVKLDNKYSFYNSVTRSAARIVDNTRALSTDGSYSVSTGQVSNVIRASVENKGVLEPGVDPLYKGAFIHYDGLVNNNYLADDHLWEGNVKFFTDSISGGWPRRFYNDAFEDLTPNNYNAIEDIYTYATFTKHRMNAISSPTGGASIATDSLVALGHSGIWNLTTSVESLASPQGLGIHEHVRVPYYIPATNEPVPLLTGDFPSESNESLDNSFLNTEYIKAYAALYATQIAPVAPNYTGSNTGNVHDVSYVPAIIAMSGLGVATENFETQFSDPYYNGTSAPITWLSKYNRMSELAARHLTNCTSAFNNLYYGNNEWAGYTGYNNQKLGPFSDDGVEFSGDLGGEEIVVWGDGTYNTWSKSFSKAINSLNNNFSLVGDAILEQIRHGGILEPNYINAIRPFLWLPQHVANRDTLFYPEYYDVAEAHINIFNEAAGAILRGAVSKDGILTEGGSFKLQPAPFSGKVPSKLFEMAAEAIEFYRTTGNIAAEDYWLGVSESLYNMTEELYSFDGGYPFNTIFSSTNAPGDPGAAPLQGYLSIISKRPDAYTTAELLYITGDISRAY